MTWIRLFHRTDRKSAGAILQGGFLDHACRNFPPGVWLSNHPFDTNEGTKMGALFEVLVDSTPDELFYTYEVVEADKPNREFIFPAKFLNSPEKCRLRLLTEEDECGNELGPFWNEYPSGEPENTYLELQQEDTLLEADCSMEFGA